MKEDSPKMFFCSIKKIINDGCLELVNTKKKTLENFAIVSGTKRELIAIKIITI